MKKLLLTLFLGSFYQVSSQIQEYTMLKKGDVPKNIDIELLNTQGSSLSLKNAMNSNGLVVIFSCNSCPFVIGTENFPGWENTYNSLFNEAKRLKIGFILINSNEGKRKNEDSFENMKLRAEEKNYLMPYLLDENSKVANSFGAKTTPHVFLLDKDFKLLYSGSIDNMADNKRKEHNAYLLNALLSHSLNKKIKNYITNPVGCSIKRLKTKS